MLNVEEISKNQNFIQRVYAECSRLLYDEEVFIYFLNNNNNKKYNDSKKSIVFQKARVRLAVAKLLHRLAQRDGIEALKYYKA